jgi:MFS family permease
MRTRRSPSRQERPGRRRGRTERTFRSLQVPNYRIFFAGHAVSVIGTWMQRVAQDWLVLELSDSALAVGVATALQALPTLFLGLWGGLLVDRLDRRKTIIATQAVSAVLAAALAVLTLTGVVQLWMVFLLALGLGLVTVLDVPARQAFVTEMVGPEDYVNAQSLNSTIHNAGRLIGPAVAGLLIAWVGSGAAFAINAVSFVAVLISLFRIDPDRLDRAEPLPRQRGQALEGLRYVWRQPELRACLILVAVVALFGQNFRVVLPLFARDVLGGGAETYGWLTSALGAGAVIGALATAARETVTAWAMLLAAAGFAVVSILLAGAPGLVVALGLLVGLGIANICFNTLARVLLQLGADPSMQGRVIALHAIVFTGSTPFGGPLIGWVCEEFNARVGMLVSGVVPLVVALALLPTLRRVHRRGDAPAPTEPTPVAAESPSPSPSTP